MKNFGNNAWLGIMNIIYSIHSSETIETMSERFLKQLKWLVPYDQAIFFIPKDKTDEEIRITASVNMEEEFLEKYRRNHVRYDHASGLKIAGNSIVYRESDIIENNVWQNSSFYIQICKPNNIFYNLHAVLSYNNCYVGEVILFRDDNTINAAEFGENAVFVMNLLKEHLSLGIHRLTSEDNVEESQLGTSVLGKTNLLEICGTKFNLTKRESEILCILVSNTAISDICDELVITANTLKKHIANIYRKMNVNSRVQLIQKVNEMEGKGPAH